MKKIISLLCITVTAVSSFALLQIDSKGFFIATDEELGVGKAESYIYAEREFIRGFSLYLAHRLDGSSKRAAMPEINIPFDNYTALGMKCNKKHTFLIGITNNVFNHANELALNFYPSDSTIIQKLLNSGNMYLQLNGKKVVFDADVTYFRLKYDLLYDNQSYSKAVDDDMWSDINLTLDFGKDFSCAIGTTLKNDFNSYPGYDYGDHHIDVSGEHMIRMRKQRLYLNWFLSEHWRISEAMYLNGDAEGLATLITIRPVIRFRKRIFLKATAKLDLSKKMQKQRYEFDFRKSWKNQSSVNIAYWSVLGSFFQRQGGVIRTVFYLVDRVGFAPTVQVYWRQNIGEVAYRYYRTTASIEGIFQVFRLAEITGGFSFSHFRNCEPFTNRVSLFLGLRKW